MNQNATFLELLERGITARTDALDALPPDLQYQVGGFMRPQLQFTPALEDVCDTLLQYRHGQAPSLVEFLGILPAAPENMRRTASRIIPVLHNNQGENGLRLGQLAQTVGYHPYSRNFYHPYSRNFMYTMKALIDGGIVARIPRDNIVPNVQIVARHMESYSLIFGSQKLSAVTSLCGAEIIVMDGNGMLMFHNDILSLIGQAE